MNKRLSLRKDCGRNCLNMDLFRRRVVVNPLLEVDQAGVDAGYAQAAAVIRAKGHNADL